MLLRTLKDTLKDTLKNTLKEALKEPCKSPVLFLSLPYGVKMKKKLLWKPLLEPFYVLKSKPKNSVFRAVLRSRK